MNNTAPACFSFAQCVWQQATPFCTSCHICPQGLPSSQPFVLLWVVPAAGVNSTPVSSSSHTPTCIYLSYRLLYRLLYIPRLYSSVTTKLIGPLQVKLLSRAMLGVQERHTQKYTTSPLKVCTVGVCAPSPPATSLTSLQLITAQTWWPGCFELLQLQFQQVCGSIKPAFAAAKLSHLDQLFLQPPL